MIHYFLLGGEAQRIHDEHGYLHLLDTIKRKDGAIVNLCPYAWDSEKSSPSELLDTCQGWDGYVELNVRQFVDVCNLLERNLQIPFSEKVKHVEMLVKEMTELYNAHISNGGNVDYSEKEYGYLSDEIEDIQVGFLRLDEYEIDSDYAQGLRDQGFEMTHDQAVKLANHRIDSVKSSIEYFSERNKI
jgi:hypothetical protein